PMLRDEHPLSAVSKPPTINTVLNVTERDRGSTPALLPVSVVLDIFHPLFSFRAANSKRGALGYNDFDLATGINFDYWEDAFSHLYIELCYSIQCCARTFGRSALR